MYAAFVTVVLILASTSSALPNHLKVPCQRAYKACDFKFEGGPIVPSFRVPFNTKRPFTPKIMSRKPGERIGVINSNGVSAEFMSWTGGWKPISAFGKPRFPPTFFKPLSVDKKLRPLGSGIAHQSFSGNQYGKARLRCVRVFFTQYQLISGRPPFVISNKKVRKADNKCVVFITRA